MAASVLITGGPGAGKDACVAGLVSLFGGGDPAGKPAERVPASVSVLTKYYEAPVALHVLPADRQPWTAAGSTASLSGDDGALLSGAEAVVHVVNAAELAAPRIQAEVAGLGAALDEAGSEAELRLVVLSRADELGGGIWGGAAQAAASASASTSHAGSRLAELTGALTGLTLDHGFEVVAADLLRPSLGAEGRDKAGLGRVREALQTVMWSTMDMTRGTAARGAGGGGTRAGAEAPLASAVAGGGEGGTLAAGDGGAGGETGPEGRAAEGAGADGARRSDDGVASAEAAVAGGGEPAGRRAAVGGGGEPAGRRAAVGGGGEPAGRRAAVAGGGEPAGPGAAAGGEAGTTPPASPPAGGLVPAGAPMLPLGEDGLPLDPEEEDAEAEGEFDFAALSAVMREAGELKAGGAALGMAERRERAAKVALRMAVLMGIDADEASGMLAAMQAAEGAP